MAKLGDYIEKVHVPYSDHESNDILEPYGVSNTKGIIKTDHIKSSDLSKYLIIKPNYFAYNPYRVNVGSIGLTPKNVRGLVSPAYVVFKAKKDVLIPELLLALLKSKSGLFLINKYARGTVRKALRYDDLCQIDINIPAYDKQVEIFNKKIVIDKEILSLNNEFINQKNLIIKLKQSILQDAIQGKLTKDWRNENPNTESASQLLERIKAEKKQLVADKKIKKEKPLPPITEEEIPFDLPEGWVWCRFKNIVDFQIGKTPASKQVNYWTSGIYNWLNIKDMVSNGYIEKTTKKITQEAVDDVFKTQKIVKENTLLMSFKLTVGKVSINKIPLYHNEAIISIFPFTGISQSFLFYVLPFVTDLSVSKKVLMGMTFNSSSLSSLLFPLPPIQEQKVIVEKIAALMKKHNDLEAERKASEANTQMLMQAVLKEVFAS